MSAVIIITTQSWWYSQVHKEQKITVLSFQRYSGLRFMLSPFSNYPGRSAQPFLTLLTLTSPFLHDHWRLEKESVFSLSKKVSNLYLHSVHKELKWYLTYFLPSFGSVANMQKSIAKKRGKQENVGKNDKEIWVNHQCIQWSTWSVGTAKRGCGDSTTIKLDHSTRV